ncbi:MAG: hypothetical protein B7Y86_11240 [Brevundimonas subvibrioides]|uniref:Uroporphyrinogen-III synthase n=1 Tax=Brevundimonas subvibrioides TaxID=74313 RepID=A0A258HI73_9CAUL|nr:MAG: hypothetical protein B7Y86_11240 [Brevundimonas subvibrioides]
MSAIARVWVTRARPGADRTARRLSAEGFEPLVAPLLEIHALPAALDLSGVQALAFTSVNGVAAFAALSGTRTLPVLAVGEATARAARDAGFAIISSADGDLADLAAMIRAEARDLTIVHACAAEPAGDLRAAVGDAARIRTLPVYEARETGVAAPGAWDAVLIHSPRAGRALAASLSPKAAEGRVAVTISPATAASLERLPFAEVRFAAAPTEDALLAALGKPGVSV